MDFVEQDSIPVSPYLEEYSTRLDVYNVEYKLSGYYWQVGEIERTQGWILHLSIVISQLRELLDFVLPLLMDRGVPFKVARNYTVAFCLIDGSLGYINLGKVISIYPPDDEQALLLAMGLVLGTERFRGPGVPTDKHLGGVVYTRYGSFNPVTTQGSDRNATKLIYDAAGQLIPDSTRVPFELPTGISWPFSMITKPDQTPPARVLHSAYLPLKTIKADIKGRVIKGIYFHRIWQIRTCLIKQGKRDNCGDEAGRDIGDRLRWQYEVHKDLYGHVLIPKVFDYFQVDGDHYLVMDFIKGKTLTDWLYAIYHHSAWAFLSRRNQLKVLDKLLEVLEIIARFHERGYIHRDIGTGNFLIDRRGEMYSIDVELSWSMNKEFPWPPFKLGTPGYMSPEQFRTDRPTVKEDIYGLGGVMMNVFTNFQPSKLFHRDNDSLIEAVSFFTGDTSLAQVIGLCQHDDPYRRPSLAAIKKEVVNYREKLKTSTAPVAKDCRAAIPLGERFKKLIHAGLSGLAHPEMLSPRGRWLSKAIQPGNPTANEQFGKELYTGWHTGVAGPMWLLAIAKEYGFPVESCHQLYLTNLEYLTGKLAGSPEGYWAGLHFGGGGVAMSIVEGLKSGLIQPNAEIASKIKECFIKMPPDLCLSTGISGTGISLMACHQWLPDEFKTRVLLDIVGELIERQEKDGSWKLNAGGGKGSGISVDLDKGIAGIVTFLLAYIQHHTSDSRAIGAAKKGMQWLTTKINRKATLNVYTLKGNLDLLFAFAKGYEVIKDNQYKNCMENNLFVIPPHTVLTDFTLAGGMARLGEFWLEAFRIFGKDEYYNRASWIAEVFLYTLQTWGPDCGYWSSFVSPAPAPDLFTGTSGILHFLIRYLYPDSLPHPYTPVSK